MIQSETFREHRLRLRSEAKIPNIWARSPSPPLAFQRREKAKKAEKLNKKGEDSQLEHNIKEKTNNSNNLTQIEQNDAIKSASEVHPKKRFDVTEKQQENDQSEKSNNSKLYPDDNSKESHNEEKDGGEDIISNEIVSPPPLRIKQKPLAVSGYELKRLAKAEEENDAIIGPMPAPTLASGELSESDYGYGLLAGEGTAMAQFVQKGKRIPRRGEIGLTPEQIEHFEAVGFVMSGSRHRKMNAVRIRKENQVYSAEEKKALAQYEYELKMAKENRTQAKFREELEKAYNEARQKVEREKQRKLKEEMEQDAEREKHVI
ncbi:putative pre-mRNA-splicing factor cwc25 [Monocercomonoides exilis]|uniref:putative pre-mRNA-splicing factor cwc25 n=1 Tax=Monocercomonoides exilis TaxID=2049356 RepID=UPI00355AAB12|nr:putative pre-mRNA-splicing factor cwc25 [Monocercomonoides exilis]|eukprot:MONOS_12884.1-p1 / transcript=MONOS_12884.1 / gene=MONOS_12884 / organism=Monocercomonoides_exilis_PA203 / gene_product=pre-mRNA-splicing factor cwc25, putative / transcript_product=pre-mRNA-splicing factor cwc25, putative / location=Mono_scaffold00746:11056-12126(+) / protein_length=317 / sequence_SO=supercontig / SO=protein_coding / is_pseudo=false